MVTGDKTMAPAGRPKMGKEKKRRVNVMLEPATYEYLRRLGNGSASFGIAVIVGAHATFDVMEIQDELKAKAAKKRKVRK